MFFGTDLEVHVRGTPNAPFMLFVKSFADVDLNLRVWFGRLDNRGTTVLRDTIGVDIIAEVELVAFSLGPNGEGQASNCEDLFFLEIN